ncbi:hypothetical protein SO802_009859 [Lithocarpus litseifolius]|uniref:SKP1-like protein n=1 Tax=Lithocarpus litseifolius TaxID=425828 RepID=A0AAW2DET0_9ROSI
MMIQEYNCAGETVIQLPILPSNILARVIEYCKKHVSESHGESLTAWDAEFVNLDNNTLYDLCVAATYLNIKGLVDLTSKTMTTGKASEQIRNTFNIKGLLDLQLKNTADLMRAMDEYSRDMQYFNEEEEEEEEEEEDSSRFGKKLVSSEQLSRDLHFAFA